ncbi:MAG: hypothetical protein Q4C85_00900 [Actinomyces sp.]|uniref:hypothetical protein n=1 Tax=Actinomyces sp. TaxID=29317 RepID=UPI0026DA913E|nr:hypothetical protein [Actinomyces sp.]MDO4242321.1 hypothetical protein [Actinomyces sp.]
MLKRYLVVIAALAVPIILAVASQMVSAPIPAAPIDSTPVSVHVSGASTTQPAPVSTAREIPQVPLPASTTIAQNAVPEDDAVVDTDEEVDSDEQ